MTTSRKVQGLIKVHQKYEKLVSQARTVAHEITLRESKLTGTQLAQWRRHLATCRVDGPTTPVLGS